MLNVCVILITARAIPLVAQNDNLQVHEEKSKGVYVKNLSDYYVSSAREVYEIMRQGGAARVVSSTSTLTSRLRLISSGLIHNSYS